MAVSVEGVALSSLLYEHNSSPGDQEGFLLGEIVSRITDTISDAQINNVKEEIVTYIHSHLPCRGLFSWYSDDGHVIHEKIRELLKNKKHKEVVGWYKFRRNSSMIMSMRERAIHRHLKESFPSVPTSNFLMCLSISLSEANLATHTFSHTFFSFNGRSFEGVPLTVINLGDTMHSDYKTAACKSTCSAFHDTVKPFQQTFLDSADNLHSAKHIHDMNARVQRHLVDVCSDVISSEKRIGDLIAEVTKLKDRAKSGRPPPNEQPLPSAQAPPKSPVLWDAQRSTPRSYATPMTYSDNFASQMPTSPNTPLVITDVSSDDSNDVMAAAVPDLIAFDNDSNNYVTRSLNINDMVIGGSKPLPVASIVTPPAPVYSMGLPTRAVTKPHEDIPDLVSSDISVSPSASSSGDTTHDDDSPNKSTKDAFAFVEDLLTQAKPRNSQTSLNLDLDTKPGFVTGRGRRATKSKSVVTGEVQRTGRNEEVEDGTRGKTRAGMMKGKQTKTVDDRDCGAMDYDLTDSPTF